MNNNIYASINDQFQKRISEIKFEYEKFMNSPEENEIYLKYLKFLENNYEEEIQKLNAWKEKEILIIKKNHDYELKQDHYQFLHNLDNSTNQTREYIQGKALALAFAFPQAQKYFQDKYNFPFKASPCEKVEVEKYDISKMEISQPILYQIDFKTLKIGNLSFHLQSKCRIQLVSSSNSSNIYYQGYIKSFNKSGIIVQLVSGEDIEIPKEMIINKFVIINT